MKAIDDENMVKKKQVFRLNAHLMVEDYEMRCSLFFLVQLGFISSPYILELVHFFANGSNGLAIFFAIKTNIIVQN